MFGFSNDCKKDIKINIMLNALMEYDTNDIEKVEESTIISFDVRKV